MLLLSAIVDVGHGSFWLESILVDRDVIVLVKLEKTQVLTVVAFFQV